MGPRRHGHRCRRRRAPAVWGVVKTWDAVRRPATEFGPSRSDRTAFLIGASVGLIGAMLHCIVDFNMQIPADAITAITLMALIAANARFATEAYWKNPGFFGKILLTLLAAGAVVLFGGGRNPHRQGNLLAAPGQIAKHLLG